MALATAEELEQAMDEAIEEGHVEAPEASDEKPKRSRRKKSEPEPEPEATAEEVVADSTPEPESESAPAEDEQPEFLKRVSELGFADVESEEDAQARVIEALREARERQENYERRLKEAETFATYGKQFLAQQPPKQESTEEAQKHWWNAPEVDLEEARRYLVETEEGREWKPDTPPELRAKVEQHVAYVQGFQHKLLEKPHEVLPQIIEHEFDRLFEERYGSRVQEKEAQEYWAGVWERDGEWAFRKDPVTNKPDHGRMTPAGEFFYERAAQLVDTGMSHQDAYRYAKFDTQDRFGELGQRRAPEQPKNTTDPHEQRKEDVRKRALRGAESIPDRRGSFTDADETRRQNENVSPGWDLIEEAKKDGLI